MKAAVKTEEPIFRSVAYSQYFKEVILSKGEESEVRVQQSSTF
jgi:hypothetical protein